MTNDTLHKIPLENGLVLEVREKSRRYFGDYFTVNVEIECRVPVDRRFFDDDSSFEAASRVGKPVSYRRTLRRSGVPSSLVAATKEELFMNFKETALSYLSSQQFPRKMIESETVNAPVGKSRI